MACLKSLACAGFNVICHENLTTFKMQKSRRWSWNIRLRNITDGLKIKIQIFPIKNKIVTKLALKMQFISV